jgi:hypothetical protein
MKPLKFDARQIPSYAEPVAPEALEVGHTYYAIAFIDPEMLTPIITSLVYVGRDLEEGDCGWLYFEDPDYYHSGIEQKKRLTTCQESNVGHIFEFEHAFEVLMRCSLRRRKPEATGGQ